MDYTPFMIIVKYWLYSLCLQYILVTQMVKNLPTMQETWVWFLGLIPGQENSLEKWMSTHSSIFAWIISWTEEPSRLQSMGHRVGQNWATDSHTQHIYIYTHTHTHTHTHWQFICFIHSKLNLLIFYLHLSYSTFPAPLVSTGLFTVSVNSFCFFRICI